MLARGRHHTVFADLSLYRDSFRQPNTYVSIAWTHELIGPLRGGFVLAASTSSAVNNGEPFMVPVPVLSWRADRAALHVLYLAIVSNINAYPSVAAYATLYPLAPARAERSVRASPADRSVPEEETGVEFSAGPYLTLHRFESAAIALRCRHGSGSWRLAADVGAAIASSRARDLQGHSHPSGPDIHRYDLELRAERLHHAPGPWGATLLMGGGPILGYTNQDPARSMRVWRLGAAGTWGVEWRPARTASLAAEQGADLLFESGRTEEKHGGAALVSRMKSVSLGPRVRLGVTAWIR